jgi:DNA-binding NarL/FixJ family response regulator
MTLDNLRVAIVDDHPVFRLGLAVAIREMEEIELVGEAERADQVAELVAGTTPDVLLLDVRLPDGNGLELNRWLHEHHPDVKVIMLTMSEELDTVRTALRDGAKGYLVKGALPETVEGAIRAAASGTLIIDAAVGSELISVNSGTYRGPDVPFRELTPREREVLDAVARGLNNAAVARRVHLAEKSVRNNVSIIMAKLHVDDRNALIVLARQHGLGDGHDPDWKP